MSNGSNHDDSLNNNHNSVDDGDQKNNSRSSFFFFERVSNLEDSPQETMLLTTFGSKFDNV